MFILFQKGICQYSNILIYLFLLTVFLVVFFSLLVTFLFIIGSCCFLCQDLIFFFLFGLFLRITNAHLASFWCHHVICKLLCLFVRSVFINHIIVRFCSFIQSGNIYLLICEYSGLKFSDKLKTYNRIHSEEQ